MIVIIGCLPTAFNLIKDDQRETVKLFTCMLIQMQLLTFECYNKRLNGFPQFVRVSCPQFTAVIV
jgi:hypothetical protein